MKRNPIKILRDLLVKMVNLPTERILLFNTDYKIPNDDGLYIVIMGDGATIAGSYTKKVALDDGILQERRFVEYSHRYTINIMSGNEEAEERYPEIISSLNSYQARKLCEQWGCKIGLVSDSILPAHEKEGANMVTRYLIRIFITGWYMGKSDVPYFENPEIDFIIQS
jgi:hypothetical protein